jgi:hypothetical protein
MKLLKQPILNTNPTKNNRKYPIEVLESIKRQINERNPSMNIGTIGYPEGLEVSLSKAAFKYSNAVIEKDVLYVDIETIHTPEGIELRKMLEVDNDIRFRPGGQATLQGEVPEETHNLLKIPKYVSEDYQLITIAAITPDEDAMVF